MDAGYEAIELAKAVEMMTVAPYWHVDEKEPRLKRAQRWCLDGKVHDLGGGGYTVDGSKPGSSYTLKETECQCESATKSKSKWCYHAVAVKLYQEWQRRISPAAQQMALGTTPKTVDERLAQEAAMATPTPSPTDVPPTAAPQVAPVVTTVPSTSLVPVTSLAAVALEESLAEWSKQRAVITRYIQQHFQEGTDFYTIRVGGRETKPTLGKPGAEKFLSLFQLQAAFRKDDDTWEMLGRPPGTLCYVCSLLTRSGEVVGEGRGVRDIKKDGGDSNKAVKMAQKSAQIDAILRTGALSDAFTQDLDEGQDDQQRQIGRLSRGTSARGQIVQLLQQLGFTGTTRDAYEHAVKDATGMLLHPDNYPTIVEKLTQKLREQAA